MSDAPAKKRAATTVSKSLYEELKSKYEHLAATTVDMERHDALYSEFERVKAELTKLQKEDTYTVDQYNQLADQADGEIGDLNQEIALLRNQLAEKTSYIGELEVAVPAGDPVELLAVQAELKTAQAEIQAWQQENEQLRRMNSDRLAVEAREGELDGLERRLQEQIISTEIREGLIRQRETHADVRIGDLKQVIASLTGVTA